MAKPKKEKRVNKTQLPKKSTAVINPIEENNISPFSNATESLMPELEELVKKNPNRLIGCGG